MDQSKISRDLYLKDRKYLKRRKSTLFPFDTTFEEPVLFVMCVGPHEMFFVLVCGYCIYWNNWKNQTQSIFKTINTLVWILYAFCEFEYSMFHYFSFFQSAVYNISTFTEILRWWILNLKQWPLVFVKC